MKTVILTHMIKKDDGYLLIDTIISLLILSLTLTSTYGLIIKTLKFENIITQNSNQLIIRSEEYDKSIQKDF